MKFNYDNRAFYQKILVLLYFFLIRLDLSGAITLPASKVKLTALVFLTVGGLSTVLVVVLAALLAFS